MPLHLSILLAGTLCTAGPESSREIAWQSLDAMHHGNLETMLSVVRNTELPHPMRHERSADDHLQLLLESGRLDDLGLDEDEGRILVETTYQKLGLSLEGPKRPRAPVPAATDPPGTEAISFRGATEFEPHAGILMRWPFDWASQRDEWSDMVDALSQADVTAYIWVNTQTQRTSAVDYLHGRGVPTDHVQWIVEETNSVWIRDYGPNFLYQTNGNSWGIADFHYYDNRPRDDDTPLFVAGATGAAVMDRQFNNVVYTEGGNLIHDGLGAIIYSQRTYSKNSGLPGSTVDQRIQSAFRATKAIVPQDPTLDGTGHADMFLKLVDPENILVGKYKANQVDYQILEDAATLFASSTNGADEPFTVWRIPQPDVYYWLFIFPVVRTYTNAIISNDVIILPTYGLNQDNQAAALYEALMPGRTVYPVDASVIIESAGAWHCVVMEYPDPTNPD